MAREEVVPHLPILMARAMARPAAATMPTGHRVPRAMILQVGTMTVAVMVAVAVVETNPLMKVGVLLVTKIHSSRSSTRSVAANLLPGRQIPSR